MVEKGKSRAFSSIAFVAGIVLTGSGLFLMGTYVVGVIDILVERPADRSWLFWGLGVAFIGITLLVGGIALVVIWKKTRPDRDVG